MNLPIFGTKKYRFRFTATLLCLILTGCSGSGISAESTSSFAEGANEEANFSTSDLSDSSESASSDMTSDTENGGESESEETQSVQELPEYDPFLFHEVELQVTGIEYTDNYYNEPGAIISFTFTNHGEEFTCAYAALKMKAYQGETQLREETYFDQGTDMANLNKDVKNGDSVDCKMVFRIRTTEDVLFTVHMREDETMQQSLSLPINVTSELHHESELHHDHDV